MMNVMFARLRQFVSDTRGNASVEAVVFAPLLLLMLASAYVYFDAFRQKAINTNAAYTISDALSRETDGIDDAYMDGMHELFEFLTRSNKVTGLRVTVVSWDETAGEYSIDWTENRGSIYPINDRSVLQQLNSNMPPMLDNERVIVVETSSIYNPPINIATLGDFELYNFAFTRPRFAPKLEWETASNG